MSGLFPTKRPYKVLDLFAGRARITEVASKCAIPAACYDYEYGKERHRFRTKAYRTYRSAMDFNGDAGFANPGRREIEYVSARISVTQKISPSPQPLPARHRVRLVVLLVLNSAFGQTLAAMGTVCSTWTTVNAGTSKRSILCPDGDPSGLATRKGNIMVGRTAVGSFEKCCESKTLK